ncbi:MAG TPA: hypothetical protein PKC54_05245 [Ferruginibacter sp.]|nr:hypothetical protein [Ferruginibacter sp.]
MITEKDRQFIVYWERERTKLNTVKAKLLNGLPMAVLFSLPVLLLLFVVQVFLPEWYTRISNTSGGTFIAIVVALFISIVFFAYFRMHYKWEMNEQLYLELKSKTGASETNSETN